MIIRGLLFLLVFAALHLGWECARGTALEYRIIHDGTVQPAVHVISLLTPRVHAHAAGFAILAPGGGINILNGCEGIDVMFLLLAAFAVAPLSMRARLAGALWGTGLVFVANQLRIIALFYAYRADHALFYPLHATVAPMTLVLVVGAFFYVWLNRNSLATAA
jgi:exosortase/archaeosortase family protein